MILKRFLSGILLLSLFASCGTDPLDVDTSSVNLELDFVNLDSVIYRSDSVELITEHRKFKKDLGELYEYYLGYVMRIGDVEDTAFYNSISLFRSDEGIQMVEKEISQLFVDFDSISDKLTDGFKHLKYHLPDRSMPEEIVFMNSLFTSNVWCSDKGIGIGLERYLGPNAESVKRLPPEYFDWVRKAMDRKFLEVDVLTAWIETNIVEEESGSLAEKMVRWGKILYLVKAAFPEVPDYLILRYNEDQLLWAQQNEYAFWTYLVEERMLFEENERNDRNFLNPGPTTSGLPQDGSPDRLGRFIGWHMVHSYLNQNEITPAELLQVDYNTILQNYEIE